MHKAIPQLHDFLLESAQKLPDKVALVCKNRRWTFRELDRASNAIAHALMKRGVVRGDRVVIFAENSSEAAVSFWSALKANAVAVVVNPEIKTEKLSFLLNDCRASALISQSHLAKIFQPAVLGSRHVRTVVVVEEASADRAINLTGITSWIETLAEGQPEEPPPRRGIDMDLASIIYTSGSTGDPKGVMLTHRNMIAAAESICSYLEIVEHDVILGMLPLSFDYGLYQMIMAFRTGARLVLEESFAYPAHMFNLMASEGVTGFPGVPTIFAILNELRDLISYDFSKVRYVTNTAAALSMKHIEMLRRVFPKARIFSMYGLTECKRCTYLPPEDLDRKPLSVGLAIPNTEIWIVNEKNERAGPDEVGQLVVRGSTVMRGYWERPEETAQKLRPGPLPGEIVLYTGDLCKFDEEGYLYFVGRMDDIIKSRGEKVAPKEVEQAIMNIKGVKEAAVIGVPDDILGEAIKAFVVLDSEATLSIQDIIFECQKRLENFMMPKFVEIVRELPHTVTGKVRKNGLC